MDENTRFQALRASLLEKHGLSGSPNGWPAAKKDAFYNEMAAYIRAHPEAFPERAKLHAVQMDYDDASLKPYSVGEAVSDFGGALLDEAAAITETATGDFRKLLWIGALLAVGLYMLPYATRKV